jgi:D-aspartate ligase
MLKHREKLERYYHIPMASLDVAEILLNKKKFFQMLQKQKIPHAQTFFPIDEAELESISKDVRYPCMVKPIHSESFRFEFKTKSFRADSSKELIEGYNKSVGKNQEAIIQEIIPGPASCMYGLNAYYDKTGTPDGVFMYRRIREWPHDFGNGCTIESVKVPELKEIIDPLTKKIGYYGIVDAEFKKDPRNNEFKLIEINARCWMQVSLPARCGSNIPYIAYMDAIGAKVVRSISVKEHVKWISLVDDIQSSVKSMLEGNFSLRKWIDSFRGKKEYSVFASDDPLPFFVLIADLIFGAHCYRTPP